MLAMLKDIDVCHAKGILMCVILKDTNACHAKGY